LTEDASFFGQAFIRFRWPKVTIGQPKKFPRRPLLGYDHTVSGLMSPTLATGIRETPTAVIDQFFAGV